MHILVLTSLFPHTPGEKPGNFVLDQVRALAELGISITVVVAKPWIPTAVQKYTSPERMAVDPAQYSEERFRVVNANFFSLPKFALGRFASFFIESVVPAIEYVNRQLAIDIIHVHGLPLGHAAVEAGAILRVPVILTIHGVETAPRFDDSPAKRDQIGDTLDRANRVLLVGSPLLEYVRRYTRKVDHCVVIGNGFKGYEDQTASSLITKARQLRVIAVSNYEESKGFELLVEALGSMDIPLRNRFELVLVGAGDGFSAIHKRVQQLGLEDSVHYLGPLLHRQVMSEMAAADVFCLPSWREAFGIVYAEAMSLGKLAMACVGQGPADFIRHLQTGFLIEPRSSSAVAHGLRWVADNPERVQQIAERGKNYVREQLTWEKNAVKVKDLYQSVIARRATA